MTALAPIPPDRLRRILELDGWSVWVQDDDNWILTKGERSPILIPKAVDLVPMDLQDRALDKAKMDNATYFRLLQETEDPEESQEPQ